MSASNKTAKQSALFEDAAAFGAANLEAMAESSSICVKGMTDFTEAWFALARQSFDGAAAATQLILASANPRDAAEAQNAYARKAFEQAVAANRQLSDMCVKTAGDALVPLNERFEAAAETFAKPFNG